MNLEKKVLKEPKCDNIFRQGEGGQLSNPSHEIWEEMSGSRNV